MQYITNNIAINLRNLRKQLNISLDEAADQTGISKSMLGQIERGVSNPTVVTIEKIVSGLRVPFSYLISAPESEPLHIKKNSLIKTKETNEYTVYTYFPYEDSRDFEIYIFEIQPHCEYRVGGHGVGTVEFCTVIDSTMTLITKGKEYIVPKGDAIRFSTEEEHIYRNETDELLRIHMVFTWKVK